MAKVEEKKTVNTEETTQEAVKQNVFQKIGESVAKIEWKEVGKKVAIGLGLLAIGAVGKTGYDKLSTSRKNDAIECQFTEVPVQEPVEYMSVTGDSNNA